MSNNNNAFNEAPAAANPQTAQLASLNSNRNGGGGGGARVREATTIRIDSESHHPLLPTPSTRVVASAQQQQQPQSQSSSTSIDMESSDHMQNQNSTSNDSSPPSLMNRQFLTLLTQARTQLTRHTPYPGVSMPPAVATPATPEQRHALSEFTARTPREDNRSTRNSTSINARASATMPPSPSGSVDDVHAPHSRRGIRSWRMNLNDVLSFSSAPSTEALRSLITHSSGFRYTSLSTSENTANAPGDNIHLLLRDQAAEPHVPASSSSSTAGFRASAPTLRSNSMRDEVSFGSAMPHSLSMSEADAEPTTPPNSTMPPFSFSSSAVGASIAGRASINDATAPHHHHQQQQHQLSQPAVNGNNFNGRNNGGGVPRAANTPEQEEDNVIAEMLIKAIGHFVRYLPFIGILFIKFIHDHLLGILDLLLLHGIMYQVNKTLREQIAKFSQKSYAILFRDFGLVAFVIAYRFMVAGSQPDPFGLLIAPPSESITIAVSSITTNDGGASIDQAVSPPTSASEVLSQYLSTFTAKPQPSVNSSDPLGNTVTITKAISFGVLLYYVAVNDLVLKLITILIKITITMMPTKVVRHKSRARMYVLVEHLSQFYRALAPVRQWLIFLFESYSGLEVISGILFSSFYMGAKGFEFFERGKSLKKAVIHLLRNMDYERKPTRDELEAAGTICAICHDAYTTPVVLECGHIFCDECVNTWFRREQTCPMCRAQVSEDPTWQDGATTFFYQLC